MRNLPSIQQDTTNFNPFNVLFDFDDNQFSIRNENHKSIIHIHIRNEHEISTYLHTHRQSRALEQKGFRIYLPHHQLLSSHDRLFIDSWRFFIIHSILWNNKKLIVKFIFFVNLLFYFKKEVFLSSSVDFW